MRRITALGALLVASVALGFTTGPPPDRVALCNAGQTCKDSDCHNEFPLNAGLAALRLELAGPPPAALPASYRRGENYRLLLSVVDPDPTRLAFGFELALARACPFPEPAGTVGVVDTARTRLASDGRIDYIQHACPGLPDPTPADCGFLSPVAGTNSWEVAWTPDCDMVDTAEVYYAVNAANLDGAPEGDVIYLGSAMLAPPGPCPARVAPLHAVKQDCDGSSPGAAEVALTWDPVPGASGYAVYEVRDPAGLATACRLAPVTACRPPSAEPLVLYTVVGLCADGSPGPP